MGPFPILAWLREASQWAKQPESQLARPLAKAMNKDDYSELSHQLSSLFHRHQIATIIATSGGAYILNQVGYNKRFVSTQCHKSTSKN